MEITERRVPRVKLERQVKKLESDIESLKTNLTNTEESVVVALKSNKIVIYMIAAYAMIYSTGLADGNPPDSVQSCLLNHCFGSKCKQAAL